MIDSIAAVWLPVTDMEASTSFYRDKLGLKVVEQEGGWTEVTAGDQVIGLNTGESPAGDGGAVIAFAVTGIEDTVAKLKETRAGDWLAARDEPMRVETVADAHHERGTTCERCVVNNASSPASACNRSPKPRSASLPA